MAFDAVPAPFRLKNWEALAKECETPEQRRALLAKFLRALPREHFDMADWCYAADCGTVACIGGWTDHLWPPPHHSDQNTCDALGLPYEQGAELFYVHDGPDYDKITNKCAARVIENYDKLGEIHWWFAFGQESKED